MHNWISTRLLAPLLVALVSALPAAPLLAAAPAQDTDAIVGAWESEEYEDSNGVFTVVLMLFPDQSIEAVTAYQDGESPYLEIGEWEADDEDNVSVTVTGTPEEEYAESTTIDFVLDGEELYSEDFTAFSDDGLLLTKIDDEAVSMIGEVDASTSEEADESLGEEEATGEEAATEEEAVPEDILDLPGAYVTGELDAGGVIGVAVVMLNEDGTAQSTATSFDAGESVPVTNLGEWVDNGDGTVTITMLQKVLADGEEVGEITDNEDSEPLDFEVVNGILINELLNLYPVDEIDYFWGPDGEGTEGAGGEEAVDDSGDLVAGEDLVMYMSGLEQIMKGNVVVLLLLADGTVSLSAQIGADAETIVELGTWEDDGDGVVTVTLDQDVDGNSYDEPYVIVLEADRDGNLTGVDYDVERYGEELFLELSEN